MDLLRLVLARQNIGRLIHLPRLLHSRKFLQIRRTIYDLPPTDDPTRQAVNRGDLFPDAGRYSDNGMLLIRACFLQNAKIFLSFSKTNNGNLDFWYAIGTGIPAIQDEAIRILQEKTKYIEQLSLLQDESSIPWTPELRSKLRDMLLYLTGKKKLGPTLIHTRIFGMLNMELPEAFSIPGRHVGSGCIMVYIHYRVRAILNYKSVYRPLPEVEAVLAGYTPKLMGREMERSDYMRMGYLGSVVSEFGDNVSDYRKIARRVCRTALRLVNYDFLRLMVTLGYDIYVRDIEATIENRFSISQAQVANARMCLSDPKIRGMMSEATLLRYRIIAGEVLMAGERDLLNDFVGPGPRVNREGNTGSIQGIVIYNTQGLDGNGVKRYKFARGQG